MDSARRTRSTAGITSVSGMCGIVGYAGPQAKAPSSRPVDVALQGLARLEYRGYDSAGVAVIDDGSVRVTKRAGKLANLRAALEGDADGPPGASRSPIPAGPPTAAPPIPTPTRISAAATASFAVVHNGIIENFAHLRAEDEADGYAFTSETDSEAAAHLVAREMETAGDLTEAMRRAAASLEGAYTLLAVHQDDPDTVVAARRNSPLVVGLGEGENFLGSERAAFVDSTKEALEIGQDQVVTVTADDVPSSTSRATRSPTPSATRSSRTPRPRRRATNRPSWPRRSTRAGERRGRHPAGPARGRLPQARRDGHRSLRAAQRRQDRRGRLRQPPRTPAPWRSTPSSTGAASPPRNRAAHEFRYRDPVVTEKTLSGRDLAVRRDHGHPDGRAPRPRAGRQGHRDLQHPRLHHPARVRCRPVPARGLRDRRRLPPRRTWGRSPPATCWACSWRRCAATSIPTRSPH